MKVYKEDGALPVKMWLDDIEESAQRQIDNLSRLPFAYRHIAVMPDAHTGYGMPIGGVLAAIGYVIPNAVGVDIGCGMCAVKTPWTVERVAPVLKDIMGGIRKAVPVGFARHAKSQGVQWMPVLDPTMNVVPGEYASACCQVGTLGGGNHFIEIQKDRTDNVWVMIHSGSRNIGLKVAKYYNDLAIRLNARWHTGVPAAWELAFLPLDSDEGRQYLVEMDYCVEFALSNRRLMLIRVTEVFEEVLRESVLKPCEVFNIAHNYAAMENHFGKNVLVHRKGATRAREGEIGIIPGSQGTSSYIVRGLGNRDSFESCSHGAGRRMGRKQAQRELSLKDEIARLDAKGVVHGIRHAKDLDEAAGAYKDIDMVMEQQRDLVEIVEKLEPMGVIKG